MSVRYGDLFCYIKGERLKQLQVEISMDATVNGRNPAPVDK